MKGKLRRISIEPADNGHMVSSEYEPDADDKGGMSYREPTKSVFQDAQGVMDHISSILGAKGKSKLPPVKGRAVVAQKMLRAAEAKRG